MARKELEWEEMDGFLRRIAGEVRPLMDVMTSAIELVKPTLTKKATARIQKLDFLSEIDSLTAWLTDVLVREPMPATIVALWFGMTDEFVEPIDEDDEEEGSMEMYVAGSERFDPQDESCDWATDPAYWPEGRYSKSRVLREIAAALSADEEHDAFEVMTAAYGIGIVHELLPAVGARNVLGERESLVVGVGHDAGSGWVIGKFGVGGWGKV